MLVRPPPSSDPSEPRRSGKGYVYPFEETGIYAKNTLPLFAFCVFTNPYFTDEDKELFKTEILYPYLTSDIYRRYTKDKIILFLNNVLLGITTPKQAFKIGQPRDDRHFVSFSMQIKDEFNEFSIYSHKTEDINAHRRLTAYSEGSLQTEICLSSDKGIKKFSELTNTYTIDTGASCTHLPYLEKWNFKQIKYIIDGHNPELDSELERINNCKAFEEDCPVRYGDNQLGIKIAVYFNPAVYLETGNGCGVYMNCLLAPQKEREDDRVPYSYLLGRTFLFQFNMNIKVEFYKVKCTFIDIEENKRTPRISNGCNLLKLDHNFTDSSNNSVISTERTDSVMRDYLNTLGQTVAEPNLQTAYEPDSEAGYSIIIKQGSIFYRRIDSKDEHWIDIDLIYNIFNPFNSNAYILTRPMILKFIIKPTAVQIDILNDIDPDLDGVVIFDTTLNAYTYICLNNPITSDLFVMRDINNSFSIPVIKSFDSYIENNT